MDQKLATFAKVQEYYKVRNDLAHQGVTSKVFSIPVLVSDLKTIIKQMKK
jgi:hypothetical protein